MDTTPRWFSDTKDGHSEWYVERFRTMAAEGRDLAGEARLIDAMVPPGSRILDAGCGPGRIGAALHDRGHTVVGADVDPVLIEAARIDHPGPRWEVADLSTLDLTDEDLFDIVVMGGNVMVFVAPGSEVEVLRRVAAHVRPGGRIVTGFHTDREYEVAQFDRDIEAAGLTLQQRFATWDLAPWSEAADFCVSVVLPSPRPSRGGGR